MPFYRHPGAVKDFYDKNEGSGCVETQAASGVVRGDHYPLQEEDLVPFVYIDSCSRKRARSEAFA